MQKYVQKALDGYPGGIDFRPSTLDSVNKLIQLLKDRHPLEYVQPTLRFLRMALCLRRRSSQNIGSIICIGRPVGDRGD